MSSIFPLLARIAANPKMAPTIANIIIAMTTAQPTENPIDAAARRNGRIFAAYIVVLLLTAILITVFTWLTWDSGNKLQDAIRQDANARIRESEQGVETLKNSNLTLGNDLETEKGKVALLQKDAANAKTAQQKVEIALERQKELTANAEKDLTQLRQAMHDRHLSAEQRSELIKLLSGEPRGPISIVTLLGDGEATTFTEEVAGVFKSAGWTIADDGPIRAVFSGSPPIGFGIIVRDATVPPPYAARIQLAFFQVGFPMGGAEDKTFSMDKVEILIGRKPNPPSN
ncbi:MAG: hypothetical protein ACRD52_17070 [Candidatus Acidiferrales bacterium]